MATSPSVSAQWTTAPQPDAEFTYLLDLLFGEPLSNDDAS